MKEKLIEKLVSLGYHRQPLEDSTLEEVETQAHYEGIYNLLYEQLTRSEWEAIGNRNDWGLIR